MGVLTTKDFNDKMMEQPKKVAPVSKSVKVVYRYELPFAPMGKSVCTIDEKGESIRIELSDKMFEPPKTWGRLKHEEFRNMILKHGFIESFITDNIPNEKKEIIKIVQYKMSHPDNTKENKINGEMKIKVNRKDISIDCIDGVVITKDEAIYKKLKKDGWNEISIIELEEGK